MFLEIKERKDLVVHFQDEAWNKSKRVVYLVDIFSQLNKLNLKIQGRETHVLTIVFGRLNLGNIAMFEKLCGVTDESQIQLDQLLKDEIIEHLWKRKSSVTSLSYHRNLMYLASQMISNTKQRIGTDWLLEMA